MYSLIQKRFTLTSYTTLKLRCEDDLSSPRQSNQTKYIESPNKERGEISLTYC